MLDFSTTYPCPTRLIGGGGTGPYGLCVMELVNVIQGDVDGEGRVSDRNPQVHPDLADMAISVNDFGFGYVSEEQRTKGLWPVIPKLIDTFSYPFPWDKYKEMLALGAESHWAFTPSDHSLVVRQYAWRKSGQKHPQTEPWDQTNLYPLAWDYALEALKMAISIHAEENNIPVAEDYTSAQIDRLTEYVGCYPNRPFLQPLEAVAA